MATGCIDKSKNSRSDEFLNLPPPDRVVMMQSPPPAGDSADFEIEDAPYKAGTGPIDFMPMEAGMEGKLVFRAKFLKAPTIIIDSE